MKPGETVTIVHSSALNELKLSALAGKKAEITEINGTGNDFRGCWVQLPEEYLGEVEWYIPKNSILK